MAIQIRKSVFLIAGNPNPQGIKMVKNLRSKIRRVVLLNPMLNTSWLGKL